jgi:L-cysteine:1D-myo-inositol 2-amino-2-deoxy-alpha-D-glucopyranoside ligase
VGASFTFMTMRLRNTETNAVQSLERHSDPVKLYVCGITPYDTTHLGHAFTYVLFDVLVRALRASGQAVRYVQNVTDIDDDIIRRARELGTTWDLLADKETLLYARDMAALNVLAPDVWPRASQTVPKIITLIARLEAQGHAYKREGNVYFRVGSITDYGRLSRLSREEMITLSAQRGGDPNDPRKQDPLDFILWQVSDPGDPRWQSPWSDGRPGWHIECSAMALEHLGPQLDVHGGGSDLIFPHHESEIAQSESATGVRPFARIWVHVGMVRYEGEKMSKSLRNLVLVRDLLGRYDADSIRVLLLRHHYREPWEYTEDQLDDAASWIRGLRAMADRSGRGGGDSALAVRAALEDDLDTARALRVLEDGLGGGEGDWRAAADLLGLRLGRPSEEEAEMKKALGWRAPFSDGGGS